MVILRRRCHDFAPLRRKCRLRSGRFWCVTVAFRCALLKMSKRCGDASHYRVVMMGKGRLLGVEVSHSICWPAIPLYHYGLWRPFLLESQPCVALGDGRCFARARLELQNDGTFFSVPLCCTTIASTHCRYLSFHLQLEVFE